MSYPIKNVIQRHILQLNAGFTELLVRFAEKPPPTAQNPASPADEIEKRKKLIEYFERSRLILARLVAVIRISKLLHPIQIPLEQIRNIIDVHSSTKSEFNLTLDRFYTQGKLSNEVKWDVRATFRVLFAGGYVKIPRILFPLKVNVPEIHRRSLVQNLNQFIKLSISIIPFQKMFKHFKINIFNGLLVLTFPYHFCLILRPWLVPRSDLYAYSNPFSDYSNIRWRVERFSFILNVLPFDLYAKDPQNGVQRHYDENYGAFFEQNNSKTSKNNNLQNNNLQSINTSRNSTSSPSSSFLRPILLTSENQYSPVSRFVDQLNKKLATFVIPPHISIPTSSTASHTTHNKNTINAQPMKLIEQCTSPIPLILKLISKFIFSFAFDLIESSLWRHQTMLNQANTSKAMFPIVHSTGNKRVRKNNTLTTNEQNNQKNPKVIQTRLKKAPNSSTFSFTSTKHDQLKVYYLGIPPNTTSQHTPIPTSQYPCLTLSLRSYPSSTPPILSTPSDTTSTSQLGQHQRVNIHDGTVRLYRIELFHEPPIHQFPKFVSLHHLEITSLLEYLSNDLARVKFNSLANLFQMNAALQGSFLKNESQRVMNNKSSTNRSFDVLTVLLRTKKQVVFSPLWAKYNTAKLSSLFERDNQAASCDNINTNANTTNNSNNNNDTSHPSCVDNIDSKKKQKNSLLAPEDRYGIFLKQNDTISPIYLPTITVLSDAQTSISLHGITMNFSTLSNSQNETNAVQSQSLPLNQQNIQKNSPPELNNFDLDFDKASFILFGQGSDGKKLSSQLVWGDDMGDYFVDLIEDFNYNSQIENNQINPNLNKLYPNKIHQILSNDVFAYSNHTNEFSTMFTSPTMIPDYLKTLSLDKTLPIFTTFQQLHPDGQIYVQNLNQNNDQNTQNYVNSTPSQNLTNENIVEITTKPFTALNHFSHPASTPVLRSFTSKSLIPCVIQSINTAISSNRLPHFFIHLSIQQAGLLSTVLLLEKMFKLNSFVPFFTPNFDFNHYEHRLLLNTTDTANTTSTNAKITQFTTSHDIFLSHLSTSCVFPPRNGSKINKKYQFESIFDDFTLFVPINSQIGGGSGEQNEKAIQKPSFLLYLAIVFTQTHPMYSYYGDTDQSEYPYYVIITSAVNNNVLYVILLSEFLNKIQQNPSREKPSVLGLNNLPKYEQLKDSLKKSPHAIFQTGKTREEFETLLHISIKTSSFLLFLLKMVLFSPTALLKQYTKIQYSPPGSCIDPFSPTLTILKPSSNNTNISLSSYRITSNERSEQIVKHFVDFPEILFQINSSSNINTNDPNDTNYRYVNQNDSQYEPIPIATLLCTNLSSFNTMLSLLDNISDKSTDQKTIWKVPLKASLTKFVQNHTKFSAKTPQTSQNENNSNYFGNNDQVIDPFDDNVFAEFDHIDSTLILKFYNKQISKTTLNLNLYSQNYYQILFSILLSLSQLSNCVQHIIGFNLQMVLNYSQFLSTDVNERLQPLQPGMILPASISMQNGLSIKLTTNPHTRISHFKQTFNVQNSPNNQQIPLQLTPYVSISATYAPLAILSTLKTDYMSYVLPTTVQQAYSYPKFVQDYSTIWASILNKNLQNEFQNTNSNNSEMININIMEAIFSAFDDIVNDFQPQDQYILIGFYGSKSHISTCNSNIDDFSFVSDTLSDVFAQNNVKTTRLNYSNEIITQSLYSPIFIENGHIGEEHYGRIMGQNTTKVEKSKEIPHLFETNTSLTVLNANCLPFQPLNIESLVSLSSSTMPLYLTNLMYHIPTYISRKGFSPSLPPILDKVFSNLEFNHINSPNSSDYFTESRLNFEQLLNSQQSPHNYIFPVTKSSNLVPIPSTLTNRLSSYTIAYFMAKLACILPSVPQLIMSELIHSLTKKKSATKGFLPWYLARHQYTFHTTQSLQLFQAANQLGINLNKKNIHISNQNNQNNPNFIKSDKNLSQMLFPSQFIPPVPPQSTFTVSDHTITSLSIHIHPKISTNGNIPSITLPNKDFALNYFSTLSSNVQYTLEQSNKLNSNQNNQNNQNFTHLGQTHFQQLNTLNTDLPYSQVPLLSSFTISTAPKSINLRQYDASNLDDLFLCSSTSQQTPNSPPPNLTQFPTPTDAQNLSSILQQSQTPSLLHTIDALPFQLDPISLFSAPLLQPSLASNTTYTLSSDSPFPNPLEKTAQPSQTLPDHVVPINSLCNVLLEAQSVHPLQLNPTLTAGITNSTNQYTHKPAFPSQGVSFGEQTPFTYKIMARQFEHFSTQNLLLGNSPIPLLLANETKTPPQIRQVSQNQPQLHNPNHPQHHNHQNPPHPPPPTYNMPLTSVSVDLDTISPVLSNINHNSVFSSSFPPQSLSSKYYDPSVKYTSKESTPSSTFTIDCTSPLTSAKTLSAKGLALTMAIPITYYHEDKYTLIPESYNQSIVLHYTRSVMLQTLMVFLTHSRRTAGNFQTQLLTLIYFITRINTAVNEVTDMFCLLDLYALIGAFFNTKLSNFSTFSSLFEHKNIGKSIIQLLQALDTSLASHFNQNTPLPSKILSRVVDLFYSLLSTKQLQSQLSLLHNPYHGIIPYTSVSNMFPSRFISPFYLQDVFFSNFEQHFKPFPHHSASIAALYRKSLFSTTNIGYAIGNLRQSFSLEQQKQQQQSGAAAGSGSHTILTLFPDIITARDHLLLKSNHQQTQQQSQQQTQKNQSNLNLLFTPSSTRGVFDEISIHNYHNLPELFNTVDPAWLVSKTYQLQSQLIDRSSPINTQINQYNDSNNPNNPNSFNYSGQHHQVGKYQQHNPQSNTNSSDSFYLPQLSTPFIQSPAQFLTLAQYKMYTQYQNKEYDGILNRKVGYGDDNDETGQYNQNNRNNQLAQSLPHYDDIDTIVLEQIQKKPLHHTIQDALMVAGYGIQACPNL